MGTAQAMVVWPHDGPVEQDPATWTPSASPAQRRRRPSRPAAPSIERLLALLPPGTTAIGDQVGTLAVDTAAGTGNLGARMLDVADPLARGVYRQLSGRAPASADEVALTPAAARRLGVGVGGSVRLADGSRTLQVVGIVEDPEALKATTIILRPDALPARRCRTIGRTSGGWWPHRAR